MRPTMALLNLASSSANLGRVGGGRGSVVSASRLLRVGRSGGGFVRSSAEKISLFSTSAGSNNLTPEEVKAAREKRKAEKEEYKRQKALKKQQQQAAATTSSTAFEEVYYSNDDSNNENLPFGDYELVQSRENWSRREFTAIKDISLADGRIWVRGRLHSIRIKGGSCFLVLRSDALNTVQGVFFKKSDDPDDARMVKYLKTLTLESICDVQAEVVKPQSPVKSTSKQDVELQVHRIHAVNVADSNLPFEIEDASKSEAEILESEETDRPFARLGQELRLNNRWVDLRVPANNAIMKIRSGVCQLYRESLYQQGFMEIQTPKLISGESESGAGVFTTDYFGTKAMLAQSPQLYKQMAISADFGRVFEIGPVFRAENSNTRRHLCEFTGLDFEMAIHEHYEEALVVAHDMFKHIFDGLEKNFAKELAVIRKQYYSEPVVFTEKPCVIHWGEGVEILKNLGYDMDDGFQDLTGEQELALGRAVKEKHNTDFFMLDKYPASIRPFYTMPCPEDKRLSNSYDMFIRGQEICSGAQRVHDVPQMLENLKAKGISPEPIQSYVNSFKHGIPPHAGAGIGLDRVVFLYLGLDNVRKASMFPRDPNRITP